MVAATLAQTERYRKHGGLDGFALCTDYCFNTGPFLSPSMFAEFTAPYLAGLIQGYHEMGFYTIKHTDGDIMPILDQLVQANPHALHSLDPQAGVRHCRGEASIWGSSLSDRQRQLRRAGHGHGRGGDRIGALRPTAWDAGGGYIFSTSNCIYTGMRLARYELMLDVWRKEGNYQS
jgi:uroporphyrinogen decarboxylase